MEDLNVGLQEIVDKLCSLKESLCTQTKHWAEVSLIIPIQYDV